MDSIVKRIITKITLFFLRLNVLLQGKHLVKKRVLEESPLRSEMFSSEQMKQHGKTLAGLHKLTQKRTSSSLLTRLTENENILLETHSLLITAVKHKRLITPGGE